MTQSSAGLSPSTRLFVVSPHPKDLAAGRGSGFLLLHLQLNFPPYRPGLYLVVKWMRLDDFSTVYAGLFIPCSCCYCRGSRVLRGFFNPNLDLNLIGTSCLPVVQCSRRIWILVPGIYVSFYCACHAGSYSWSIACSIANVALLRTNVAHM